MRAGLIAATMLAVLSSVGLPAERPAPVRMKDRDTRTAADVKSRADKNAAKRARRAARAGK